MSNGSNVYYSLRIRSPWGGPNAFCLDQNQKRLDLHRGRLIKPTDELLHYELRVNPRAETPTKFPPLDLHYATGGHLLMSARMTRCMSDLGVDNIQYFAGEVTYLPTKTVIPYSIGNIIGLISALDIDRAVCVFSEEGVVESFEKLCLDPKKIEDFDVFRMAESFHTIIVSSRLKQAMESYGLTGVHFVGEDTWEPGAI